MVKIDLDTLQLFNGVIAEDNCVCFYGAKEFTWTILYSKDMSVIKSFEFYNVINPTDSPLIENIYIFNCVKDAVSFFKSKKADYFLNALIVVVDEHSKGYVKTLLKEKFSDFHSMPKLHFFHRPEKADLFLFYLEMLEIDFTYNAVYISKELHLNIKYRSVNLTLSFRELKRLRFFLGINDKTFKIKNNVLSQKAVKEIISW